MKDFNTLHKFHTPDPLDLRQCVELFEGPATYNRAMVWLDEDDSVEDGIIAYSHCGELWLTGSSAAASWDATEQRLSGPNRVEAVGGTKSRLVRVKGQDQATGHVRDFEFILDQHPALKVDVEESTDEWEFEVAMRSHRNLEGRTFYRSGRRSGPASLQVDLKQILRDRGYTTTAIRLDFFMYLHGNPETEGSVLFSIHLSPSAAVVPQLPIIRTRDQVLSGIPLQAVVVDEHGEPLGGESVRLVAQLAGRTFPLSEKGRSGIFSCRIRGLQVGDFPVQLEASVAGSLLTASTFIMINDGRFVCFDPLRRRYRRGDDVLGYLSGNTVWTMNMPYGVSPEAKRVPIHGTVEYVEKTSDTEGVIIGIPWNAMTPTEIGEWIDYYARCGMRAVKLANWPPSLIDAVGAVSPYGAELFAIILRELERRGMLAHVDILHDTPGRLAWPEHIIGTWTQYAERGFPFGTRKSLEMVDYNSHRYTSMLRDTWCSPEVMQVVKGFYRQFTMLFKDATTILGLTTNGEGDGELGPRYVNQMCDVVRERDRNHMLTVDRSTHLARDRTPFFDCNWTEPFKPQHHRIGGVAHSYKEAPSDAFMAVQVRFFSLHRAGVYGEGDCFTHPYPTPEAASGWAPGGKSAAPWSEEYRLLVRDAVWISFVEGLPFYYNWNEILTEDEHLFPTLISDAIDWKSFEPEVPPLFIRVHALIGDEDLFKLVRYEQAFSRLAIRTGYVWDEDPLPTGQRWLTPDRQDPPFAEIDCNGAYTEPRRKSEGGAIPDVIFEMRPITVSLGYSTNYVLNRGRNVLVAYIRNSADYIATHRKRKIEELKVTIRKLQDARMFLVIIDLDEKKIVHEQEFVEQTEVELGKTDHDFCVFVSPYPVSFSDEGYVLK